MMITLRRARSIDAVALPAIERSAAELFRCDPSLAWLADAQVTDAEQHRRAIEMDEVWVAQSPDGVLMGFLSAVEVDNELPIQELSVGQHFHGQGAGRKLLLTAVAHARE
ncbi:GCN5-related N-acetyltransferase [Pseudomonas sp. GM41(2012)]|nr:GCN5-related N-acetyltransferase [Pseudomonas sp. GM41(2012)]